MRVSPAPRGPAGPAARGPPGARADADLRPRGVRPAERAHRPVHRHRPVPGLHDGVRDGLAGLERRSPQALVFDDYPFIFLTLILSLQASYAAPLILLAQNRQADRDRVQYEQDRARAERTIADTDYLTRELAALRMAVGDVATRDFLRSELAPAARGAGRAPRRGVQRPERPGRATGPTNS